ncbi:NAD(P)-binding protein [Desulfoscipio geothermicus]|uniref:Glutamate synthase (NADPH), homotetrameric/putative selenate reductase, YgfK subunit,TIGR03315 n=1 Tax=Desulfoscipio geothermicus DSM 3669 TaxID=1121426 RepID=A0A1I6DMM1_9FIRM|nr:NAD(P)-binding protein [Desulfoscipio geothermicus]SFR06618.1 glutamate synthase (NADPH), homotetrameric/putative selenate reductase, YgfK subunit,TIGR03315 [Desulfoscipio geothermicus DSM 3669]
MNKDKVGAVLVVGAGISGIQASLDLAESGYYVYLVEQSPAIGGTMPRLDKTFPTNDCSMCILSPKLVECGRHLNIEKYMLTDILDVQGEPGNFKVKLRKRARYIDLEKCTGCGECKDVCPVDVPSEFDADLGKRKAIYKMYAQAMPAAYSIEKKGTSPCKAACPAGVNAQGYVQLVKEGKFIESWQLIYKDNPLPAICGRVCTHPCESECHRKSVDKPVNIRELKRVVADVAYRDLDKLPLPEVAPSNGFKVAIIGSGPAGLSAAYQLAKQGYGVTIFEALPQAGGMLRYGIPEYRLPKKIVDLEISLLEKMGVEIKTNTPLGPQLTVDDLMNQGYKAVFLAIGAHKGVLLNIPGEDLGGVIPGVDFLRRVSLGEKVTLGKRVAVIGGGNTAMDAARTALRTGAEEVTIVYRRSEAEITAAEEEIHEAKEEGIIFKMMTSPVAVHGKDGKVARLECIQNELGEPDESGRRRPVPVAGSEFTIDVDNVIVAIGQSPDASGLNGTVELSRKNTIIVNNELATNVPGVFAAGDVVTGPATVVDAIGAGKKAACSIDRYLRNEEATIKFSTYSQDDVAEFPKHAPAVMVSNPRTVGNFTDPEQRIKNFAEVALGISEEDARREAERCLNCSVCSECGECVKACLREAVNHEMQDEEVEVEVGSIVLSSGAELCDPTDLFYFGYKKYPNVVTSIEFERILSASGPYAGHLVRPYDDKEPRKIAWIQCVGSRNARIQHNYCSSVCCMYAIKEAVIAKEHSAEELDTTIFMMDMRSYGKDFEKYYERAKNEHGVKFVRSRIYEITEAEGEDKNLVIRYANEDGTISTEEFDMVVLSVGFQSSKKAMEVGQMMGLELNKYGFAELASLTGVGTTQPGIFAAGTFAGPKDIPETVMQASAAASAAESLLGDVRGTLVKERVFPPERDVTGEEPRIGVFVCNCGINIGGVVKVPEVVEMAKQLPNVVYAGEYLYVCSQDSQATMKQIINEYNLNRVVVASCSPRTHKPLFQETLKEAGLNRYLFEMANIRDQCSWVHMHEPDKATAKAKDLVRMIVAKSTLLQPIKQGSVSVTKSALVIGGGVTGMTNALSLAEQGYEVNLVEKSPELGGMAQRIRKGFKGEDIQAFVSELIGKINNNPLIKTYTSAEIKDVSGYVGNYKTELVDGTVINHGVTVIAIGGQEYRPTEYLYGENDKVMTHLELEEAIYRGQVTDAKNVVLINCVGSREPDRPYCSRVCCSKSISLALKLKEINPETNVFILYRDIRTYGFLEELYEEARRKGVIFVRYNADSKPAVEKDGNTIKVTVTDHVLGLPIEIPADVVGLAAAILPPEDNAKLNRLFKVPLNADGFFLEAHMKLRPVDSAAEGVFMAGIAHGPKNMEENIAQAKAAAGRAATILSKDVLESHGVVAVVQPDKCAACLTCVRLCPFNAPRVNNYAAEIESVICQGCGTCAGECPNKAITLQGYNDRMYMRMIDGLFKEVR